MEGLETVRYHLQMAVGEGPKIRVKEFHNWTSTQVVKHVLFAVPETVAQVQRVVCGARQLGLRVRCTGQSHSWSPLFADENQLLLDMRKMVLEDGERLKFKKGSSGPQITAASGVSIEDLMQFELMNNVALPCNIIAVEPTVGGVVAVASHGSGHDGKTISDYVSRIRIVDSSGRIRAYSTEDDPDMMKAVQVNLGLFGIILDVTLDVIPTKKMKITFMYPTLEQILDKTYLHTLIHNHWSVEISWFPFNSMNLQQVVLAAVFGKVDRGLWDPRKDIVWVRLVDEAGPDDKLTPDINVELKDVIDWLGQTYVEMVDGGVVQMPTITPLFCKVAITVLKLLNKYPVIAYIPKAIHYRKYISVAPFVNMEYAFNLPPDVSTATAATQVAVDAVQNFAEKGKFPLTLRLEMRFLCASDSYLSPAVVGNIKNGGSGRVFYIDTASLVDTPHWQRFCTVLSQGWMKLGAVPHWGKQFSFVPNIDKYLRKVYCENIAKFVEQLNKSGADPDGIFLNNFLQQIFLPKMDARRRIYQKKTTKIAKTSKRRCVIM